MMFATSTTTISVVMIITADFQLAGLPLSTLPTAISFESNALCLGLLGLLLTWQGTRQR